MSISKKIHLREDEEILEVLRRYSLTYFHIYILGLALMVVATFFITWLFSQGWLGMTAYGAIMLFGFFLIFQTWYFARANMLVITNQRVVDIARASWLDEVVSSVSYTDVMDISFRKRGLFPNLLNYGDIHLQTKSKQFVLVVAKIHQPQKLVNFIMEQIEFYRDGKGELTIEDVYNKFIKIIPKLTDDELICIDDIIHDQLGEEIEEEVVEETVEEIEEEVGEEIVVE